MDQKDINLAEAEPPLDSSVSPTVIDTAIPNLILQEEDESEIDLPTVKHLLIEHSNTKEIGEGMSYGIRIKR